jgi:hypothetical protein
MGETENQVILDRLYERVWIGDTHDFEVMDEVFAEDAVVEYQQSGSGCGGARTSGRWKSTIPACPM